MQISNTNLLVAAQQSGPAATRAQPKLPAPQDLPQGAPQAAPGASRIIGGKIDIRV